MYQEIKSLTTKSTTRTSTIKDKDGKTLIEEKDIAKRWIEYCYDMYKKNPNESTEVISENRDVTTTGKNGALPPLRSEIEAAIKKLRPRKSPGADGVHAEMITAVGDEAIDIYHILIKKIWESEKWPIEWKTSIYLPLPKKATFKNVQTIEQ